MNTCNINKPEIVTGKLIKSVSDLIECQFMLP